jgi:hypothetical protein
VRIGGDKQWLERRRRRIGGDKQWLERRRRRIGGDKQWLERRRVDWSTSRTSARRRRHTVETKLKPKLTGRWREGPVLEGQRPVRPCLLVGNCK